ncbi:MAG: Uma2 family endonuclease [Cyanomargarita calcarea GSE-NOS-MK-12-04C]|jgi:Uma2 family endonuclease|uniref:Uma2 family endonuclease n=1 Tax=Cyanomargarita calcarea GSE-NOS-MK-12-04C TaxID=2839659 RepID=A0A951QJL8_9CYAN|nr:Uma2 family endonuclease [Cyanomargarita calcarea GSE-NOS-MK-12-04C]
MSQTQAEVKLYTFDEFIEWYPENSEVRYELHDGVIVEMPKPKGEHSDLAGFLIEELLITIKEMGKRSIWTIPKESIVKPYRDKSGYEPDIIVLNQETIGTEARWKQESVIQNPTSVKLIVEVVSTNWQDDYYNKFGDYEKMGIPEYWIVDYAALGGRKFIGNPKQATIFVCELIDGEYQMTPFRGTDRIVSPTFLQLSLTAQQIFDSVIRV